MIGMNDLHSKSALAPFTVRSYRFQWPADLATSWAFEMETLILGWYVLVETKSVLLLTLFASLQYIGTLVAPLFGVLSDRIGHRDVLFGMRIVYTILAVTLMTLVFAQVLTPGRIFIIAAMMGLVRSSDMVMRNALIGETMPSTLLIGATSFARATADSARIVGALAGAAIVASLGMGTAYAVVATLYLVAAVLTFNVGVKRVAPAAGHQPAHFRSPWRDLKDVGAHLWDTPHLLAAMYLAFLLNLTAFPLVHGLLPYVAKELYNGNQTVLGYLVASFATGALLGSLVVSRYGRIIRPARMMLVFSAMWYVMLMVFAVQQNLLSAVLALFFAGSMQTLCLVPLSTMLLRTVDERLRGRVLGIRSLAVYGLPIGLWIAGPLIGAIGYRTTASLYCLTGIAFTAFIALRWRSHLWRLDAPANRR